MSFKSVQKGIAAKDGVPMKNAGAILASASRNASPAAKKKNPKLKKVKGKAKSAKKAASKAPSGPNPFAQAMMSGRMGGGQFGRGGGPGPAAGC